MDGKADLHLHTTFSDGAHSTRDLLYRAQAAGLTTVSITDHDHTGAIAEAFVLGKSLGIEVIAGVELSTSVAEQDVHLLAYFFNPENGALRGALTRFREERIRRAERIVAKLHSLNVPLTLDAVRAQAGEGSVGRPHIANALVEEGLIGSYQEAFAKYLGTGKPAYEKKYQLSPREAIALVSEAGGLSFLAHPGNAADEALLGLLIREGIDGIEVVHPSHTAEMVAYFRGIAEQHYLLTSGGSDFHGGRKNDDEALGRYVISPHDVEAMRRRLLHGRGFVQ